MEPYVSFVLAARNDNYGGDFLRRMQVFVNALLPLWEKHDLDAELVIVEWNPPDGRPLLKDAITWPEYLKPGTVRVIRVPRAIHLQLPNSEKMPMFEFIAKNVGVRRARGEYVLVTNPDLLYSEELIAYLASKNLSKSCFYRIDRYDFRGLIPLGFPPQDALRFAKRHVYQVHIRPDRQRGLCVKIGWLHRWYYHVTGRWPSSYDGNALSISGKEPVISFNDDNRVYGGIHTNASGDFLLASSDRWRQIRGFPEFTDTCTQLDSYACHQLKALGLEQALFLPPCMILHAEHPRSEMLPHLRLPNDRKEGDLRRLRSGAQGPAINDESWGLVNEELSEVTIDSTPSV